MRLEIGLAVAAALALLAIGLLVLHRLRGARRPALEPRPVLTQYELSFYRRLVPALERIGGVDVFAQVSMGTIIEASRHLDPSTRRSLRNRFDRKVVDFVVVDQESNVLLLVELDDRTHDAGRDRDRDALTASVGYRTMRIRGRAARDPLEIERLLRLHLSSNPS